MLSRLGGGNAVLGVKTVRRHHVDDVDVGVARDLLHRVVAEDVLLGKAVFVRPLHPLVPAARDDSGELAVLGLEQRRRQAAGGVAAEADERDAELPVRGRGVRGPGAARGKGDGRRGGDLADELAAGDGVVGAGRFHGYATMDALLSVHKPGRGAAQRPVPAAWSAMSPEATSSQALSASPWLQTTRTAKSREGAIQTTAMFMVLLPVCV